MALNTQPLAPKPTGLAISPQQRQFLQGFTKATGLDPNVSAAWLRNEEPAISQNTDPAGHGRYNFLNVGIQDNKSYSAASPYWQNPAQAGTATGNWLAGRLALPGYGKSSSGIQAITKSAGLTPQQQIRAIQTSGWASGGETALPGLYRQASGAPLQLAGGGTGNDPAQLSKPTGPSRTGLPIQAAPAQSLPTMFLGPLQQSLDLGQQTGQRALDALGKLSGRNVVAQQAPDLSTLMAQQPTSTAPTQHVTVPLKGPTPKGLTTEGQKAVELAKHYLGTKYVFGGASPKAGFDCSGLIQYTMAQLGIKIPRTAAEQAKAGKPVNVNHLEPGDALSFSEDGVIGHTGMYIGNGQFIQAPHTGDVVKISPLAGHYASILVGARRFT